MEEVCHVNWEQLPVDMWREIFLFLDGEHLLCMISLNTKISKLGDDETIWEKLCWFYRNKPDCLSWKRFYFQFARYSQQISFSKTNSSTFTVLKNPSGFLYSDELCNDPQNFLNYKAVQKSDFKQISFPSRIVQVSVGNWHCLALGEDFSCWGWGYNYEKQLGLGSESPEEVLSPQPIIALYGKRVIQFSCRSESSFALTFSGEIWEWGEMDPEQEDVSIPRINPSFRNKNIVQLCSGTYHTLALNDKGQLYSFGSNMHGQLGNGKFDFYYHHNQPFLIQSLPSIKQVSCYGTHNLVLTESGQCYYWGGLSIRSYSFPRLIKSLEGLNVKQLSLQNSKVCLVLLKDGSSLFWKSGGGKPLKPNEDVYGQKILSSQRSFAVYESGVCYQFKNIESIGWPGVPVALPF